MEPKKDVINNSNSLNVNSDSNRMSNTAEANAVTAGTGMSRGKKIAITIGVIVLVLVLLGLVLWFLSGDDEKDDNGVLDNDYDLLNVSENVSTNVSSGGDGGGTTNGGGTTINITNSTNTTIINNGTNITNETIPDLNLSTDCDAIRNLPDCYTPGESFSVEVQMDVGVNITWVSMVEGFKSGWNVSNIVYGGTADKTDAQITWGPFYSNENKLLTYDILPPANATGDAEFSGVMRCNKIRGKVSGDSVISNC